MGKIYQVFLRAEAEQRKNLPLPQRETVKVLLPALPHDSLSWRIPEWFRELKSRLLVQCPRKDCQVIMFTGTNRECGCTSTAAGFAGALANSDGHQVLLLDFNFRFPGLQRLYQDGFQELFEIFKNKSGISLPKEGTGGNLCVVSCNGNDKGDAFSLLDSPEFSAFMEEMRNRFDFILVDTPPITMYSESRLIASKIDGVVLVLEAGKSRWQLAERAKKEIESAGGQLLGVVLNRRKFHIPTWLYRRL